MAYYKGPIQEIEQADLDQRDVAVLLTQADNQPVYPPDQFPQAPADSLNPVLISDGFGCNVHLKYTPYHTFAVELRRLDQMRREANQGLWLPRWYAVPPDVAVPVAAGDTLNYEVRAARGSVLWGYNFALVEAEDITTADLRISIQDVCTGRWLVSDLAISQAFQSNFSAGGTPNSGFPFVLMIEPYLIKGNGELLVNINNAAAVDAYCQLLLMVGEPAGFPQ